MDERLVSILSGAMSEDGSCVVLTGAGISAESGIPTFRGKEGYWVVGSREYHPQEMATNAMFGRMPDEVWQWYLYRRGVCHNADPNPAHLALVDLEQALGDRFLLITQNVDGLHRRSGNSRERTYEIHGNIDTMRCKRGCTSEIYPIPDEVPFKQKGDALTDSDRAMLRCPRCGESTRPHVLWFDECYDEQWYRFQSSLTAAMQAALLLVIGTSGATNLPMQVGGIVAQRGAAMIDINPQPNPFSRMATASSKGCFVQSGAGDALPEIVAHLIGSVG